MEHQPVNARLHQPAARRGFGKGCQVSAQADRARQTTAASYQEKKGAAESEREAVPLVATEDAADNCSAQKHGLQQHPKSAALKEGATHICRRERSGLEEVRQFSPACSLKACPPAGFRCRIAQVQAGPWPAGSCPRGSA